MQLNILRAQNRWDRGANRTARQRKEIPENRVRDRIERKSYCFFFVIMISSCDRVDNVGLLLVRDMTGYDPYTFSLAYFPPVSAIELTPDSG
jgi:hypothetical protein